ncbi:hypothetical protein ACV4Q0_004226, partial [Yersinia enterocolitica]
TQFIYQMIQWQLSVILSPRHTRAGEQRDIINYTPQTKKGLTLVSHFFIICNDSFDVLLP